MSFLAPAVLAGSWSISGIAAFYHAHPLYALINLPAFFVSMLIISLSGVTPMQAMGMAVGCLSSVGSTMDLFGVADVSVLPAWTKLYCSFLMILGRVEIFSFLVVIQTAFGYLRRRW